MKSDAQDKNENLTGSINLTNRITQLKKGPYLSLAPTPGSLISEVVITRLATHSLVGLSGVLFFDFLTLQLTIISFYNNRHQTLLIDAWITFMKLGHMPSESSNPLWSRDLFCFCYIFMIALDQSSGKQALMCNIL